MKKYFLVLAICVYSLSTNAAEILTSGTCGSSAEACSYTLDSEGLLHISGNGKIGNAAFVSWSTFGQQFGSQITNVVIDKGITGIGNSSFMGCTNMSDIFIPDTVTKIDDQAFYNVGLKNIVIPKSVKTIGNSAFLYAHNLEDITIEGRDVQIGNIAFEATSLTHYAKEGISKVTTKAGSLTEQRMKAITSSIVSYDYIPDKPQWTIPEIETVMGDSQTGEMTFTFE